MRLPVNRAVPLAALIFLNGCGLGGSHHVAQLPPPATNGPAADYPMVVGDPFTIDGTTYTPVDRLNYDALGYASIGTTGASTGQGEGITAAHKTLPLPSYVEVTSLASGITILVRVERRGPMTNDVLIELSPDAADQLGVSGREKAAVRVRRVNPPEADRALLRAGHRAPERMETPKPLLDVLTRKLAAQEPLSPPASVPNPQSAAPTAAPEPAPSPVSATMPMPEPMVEPSPAPVATPTPLASPTPKPTPEATPAPASAQKPAPKAVPKPAASGTWTVQAATFSTSERADKAAAALHGKVNKAGRFWRMWLGPYPTQAEAKAALAKAKSAGYSDARIQRAD